ncbi:hypothetical protein GUA87_09495 [Sneathiella sp. P13V-1]|uniref:hypothetical protein n=1 Tax=Sneathiella sp. P13V-1 TaxID=2697366 RepID=UPI00187B72BC|nr:hypothetical protein [Sneathiella sp. P13V-1]MBE7637077.1 hypothetical protein [Sneathiella sp. P13V-1]
MNNKVLLVLLALVFAPTFASSKSSASEATMILEFRSKIYVFQNPQQGSKGQRVDGSKLKVPAKIQKISAGGTMYLVDGVGWVKDNHVRTDKKNKPILNDPCPNGVPVESKGIRGLKNCTK